MRPQIEVLTRASSAFISEKLRMLLDSVKRKRNMGSESQELCYVAKGNYQGLIDLPGSLKVTGIAAGKVILEEAMEMKDIYPNPG